MTLLIHRSLAAAASVAALLGSTAPAFAAGAHPLDVKATYRAATDEYCLDLTNVEGPRVGSLLPNIQCRSKTDWAAAGLSISRN